MFTSDFKQNNAGHVIQLGSVAGREGYAGGSIYCATVSPAYASPTVCIADLLYLAIQKHALRGFTVALMKELVNTPIRVTEVQPGQLHCTFRDIKSSEFRTLHRHGRNMYVSLNLLSFLPTNPLIIKLFP